MTKIWEHDLKNDIMLQIFLSCSQMFHRKQTKRWEHDKKYWSMMKSWEHDLENDIMLQFVLSCSQKFGYNHRKSWEHDKSNWSMMKMWEQHKICRYFDRWNNVNLGGDLLRKATKDVFRRMLGKVDTLWEHDKKSGSTCIKRFVMLPIFLSCSQFFYHAPNFFIMLPIFLSCS